MTWQREMKKRHLDVSRLVIKDETLWERFNQEAARGKNWVGPGF